MSLTDLAILASSVLLAFVSGISLGSWLSASKIEPMEEATMAPLAKRR